MHHERNKGDHHQHHHGDRVNKESHIDRNIFGEFQPGKLQGNEGLVNAIHVAVHEKVFVGGIESQDGRSQ
jgi:hypothetical protein